jgi:hypothetical protein
MTPGAGQLLVLKACLNQPLGEADEAHGVGTVFPYSALGGPSWSFQHWPQWRLQAASVSNVVTVLTRGVSTHKPNRGYKIHSRRRPSSLGALR